MIINQLPLLMAESGMSIRQLAKETGVTYSTIWALVHGRRRSVQLAVLDAVCGTLAVQPGDIFKWVAAGEESMPATAVRRTTPSESVVRKPPSRSARSEDGNEWRSW